MSGHSDICVTRTPSPLLSGKPRPLGCVVPYVDGSHLRVIFRDILYRIAGIVISDLKLRKGSRVCTNTTSTFLVSMKSGWKNAARRNP